jgi:hypothetical protein
MQKDSSIFPSGLAIRYIHSVNSKQVEAQGKYLDAIKLGKDGKEAA